VHVQLRFLLSQLHVKTIEHLTLCVCLFLIGLDDGWWFTDEKAIWSSFMQEGEEQVFAGLVWKRKVCPVSAA
jgi:hypothetical protein